MDSRPKPMRWLDRLSIPLELGGTAIALILLWYFTDISLPTLIGIGIAFTVAPLLKPVKRRYGINDGWEKLILGFGLLGLGI
jgi:predicted PurR-regulated permease PerM